MDDNVTAPDHQLTWQDYDDIWYLVDYHGSKMWPADHVKRLVSGIKNAKESISDSES